MLRVREIKALSDDQYEVVLADDGGTQTVVCRIVKDREIMGITMDPDILWSEKKEPTPINVLAITANEMRDVTKTVVDYHLHRHKAVAKLPDAITP